MNAFADLVLEPIRWYSGKELAVEVALVLILTSILMWLLIRIRYERPFLREYYSFIEKIRETKGLSQEERVSRIDYDDFLKGSQHRSGWEQYKSSFDYQNGRVESYTDPAPFFAAERIEGHNYVKWSSTLAGAFLTIGLFFTFVGLTNALLQIGGNGEAAMEPTQLRRAVEGILAVSAAKFITSIAGIGAYIGWSLIARRQADRQDKAVEDLVAEIRTLSTYFSPEMVLRKQLRAVEEQHQQFQTFGTQLAVTIGREIDKAMASRLNDLPQAIANTVAPAVAKELAPVREDLVAIGHQIGQAGGALAHGAGDVFTRVWQDGVGSHIARFGEQMAKTIAALEALPNKVQQTETNLGAEIERAATHLSETATRLSATFEQGQQSVTAALENFNNRVASIPEIVEQASRESAAAVKQSVEASLEGLATATARMSQASAEQLGAEVGKIGSALSASAESLRAAGDYSAEGLRRAREELSAGVRQGAELISETALDASAKLAETMTNLGTIVGGLTSRLEQTNALFEAHKGHLMHASELVSGASATLAQSANSVEAAASPLSRVVTTMHVALESVRQATEQVRTTAESSARMAELISEAADKAQGTIGQHAERFTDLQFSVQETMQNLVRGVQGLGNEISECIDRYDDAIAKSIASLETALLGMEDVLSEKPRTTDRPVNA